MSVTTAPGTPQAPAREIRFDFEGQTFFVNDPTVDQFVTIEARRTALTQGQYNALMNTATKPAQFALDLVDTVAVLGVLVPELRLTRYQSYLEVPVREAKALVNAYRKQVLPWYAAILRVLFAEDDEPVTLPNPPAA